MPDRFVDSLEMVEIGNHQNVLAIATDRLVQEGATVEQAGQGIGIGEQPGGDLALARFVALGAEQAHAIGDGEARQQSLDLH